MIIISKAILVGPVLQATSEKCKLTFYYQMIHDRSSQLEIYFTNRSTVTHNWQSKIDTITGSNQTLWQKREISIGFYPSAGYRLKIVAEAERVDFFAIDDTAFENCYKPDANVSPCGEDYFMCEFSPRLVCIAKSKVCDFHLDCFDGQDEVNCGACNFEKDTCSWEPSSNSFYTFDRQIASKVNSLAGPLVDHTSQNPNGYVMAITEEEGNFNEPATLTSPGLPEAGSMCKMVCIYF